MDIAYKHTAYIDTYIHTYTHTNTHTHIHTHTHAHTHTHTHTHTTVRFFPPDYRNTLSLLKRINVKKEIKTSLS